MCFKWKDSGKIFRSNLLKQPHDNRWHQEHWRWNRETEPHPKIFFLIPSIQYGGCRGHNEISWWDHRIFGYGNCEIRMGLRSATSRQTGDLIPENFNRLLVATCVDSWHKNRRSLMWFLWFDFQSLKKLNSSGDWWMERVSPAICDDECNFPSIFMDYDLCGHRFCTQFFLGVSFLRRTFSSARDMWYPIGINKQIRKCRVNMLVVDHGLIWKLVSCFLEIDVGIA